MAKAGVVSLERWVMRNRNRGKRLQSSGPWRSIQRCWNISSSTSWSRKKRGRGRTRANAEKAFIGRENCVVVCKDTDIFPFNHMVRSEWAANNSEFQGKCIRENVSKYRMFHCCSPWKTCNFPKHLAKSCTKIHFFCRSFSRKMHVSYTIFTCLCMKSYTLAQNPTPNPSSENANKYRMFEVWV